MNVGGTVLVTAALSTKHQSAPKREVLTFRGLSGPPSRRRAEWPGNIQRTRDLPGAIPVAKEERAAARAVLREQALPQVHDWANRAIHATETWRSECHERIWLLVDGQVTHMDTQ